MQTILKTLLAVLLGLGLLAIDAKAKTSLAFTGISDASDPLYAKTLAAMIQRHLESDSTLATVTTEELAKLVDKQILQKTEVGPADIAKLKLELAARYYAYGWVEALSVSSKRKWLTYWSVKSEWKQSLSFRLVDGITGRVVEDSSVTVTIPQKDLFLEPTADLDRKSPLERDALLRRMLPLLAQETARAVSKAVNDKMGISIGAVSATSGAAASPAPVTSSAVH